MVRAFIKRSPSSLWLALVILVVASTMMQLAGASLIATLLIAPLLWIMRWAAHMEGGRDRV